MQGIWSAERRTEPGRGIVGLVRQFADEMDCVNTGRDNDICCIAEHRQGELLRVQAPGALATDVARNILGILEAELDAQIESVEWKQGRGPQAAAPVLVQLESLEIELSTDGGEVVLRRVAGSRDEFDDLCAFIGAGD
jgi:hypothetical protein